MNDLGVPPALNSKRGSPPYGLHLRFGASLNSARHWRLYSGATLRAANARNPTILHQPPPSTLTETIASPVPFIQSCRYMPPACPAAHVTPRQRRRRSISRGQGSALTRHKPDRNTIPEGDSSCWRCHRHRSFRSTKLHEGHEGGTRRSGFFASLRM